MSDIRKKTWYFLADVKTNEYLAGHIARKSKKRDLYTKVILILATSSSIGAWAIWEKLPLLWGAIIGLSQLTTILKPQFAFSKYISVFSEKQQLWCTLSIELEKLWHDIVTNKIDPDEASKIYFRLKIDGSKIDILPNELILNDHKKLCDLAENQCNIFLSKI